LLHVDVKEDKAVEICTLIFRLSKMLFVSTQIWCLYATLFCRILFTFLPVSFLVNFYYYRYIFMFTEIHCNRISL
jgi:hypothetical protein